MNAFKISQGNLPTLTDTLTDDTGALIDLTGATVGLNFQQVPAGTAYAATATVTNATGGNVQYQFVAPQTAVTGEYQGQWLVSDAGGGVRSVPTRPFRFEIIAAVPTPPATQFARLPDLFDDVRAITGDFKKRLYEDSAIASVMRVVLRRHQVSDGRYGGGWRGGCLPPAGLWLLGADGLSISPPIENTDVQPYMKLVYNTALTLVTPNLAAYSYRTRALSERFGEQRDMLAELKNLLYELENDQAWANISGLRSWLFAVNGIWMWSYMEAENNIDLSFHC